MNVRALAVALALLFALCCAAGARASAPADDDARVAAFKPIARAAWPDSPCAGRERVYTHADAAMDAQDARSGGERAIARAFPDTCEVYIRSGLTAVAFCIAEVHEFGHLAGYGHTDDPTDVHAPAGPLADVMHGPDHMADYPPCRAATAESLYAQVRTAVTWDLPAPVAAWRVACTSMRIRRPRCTATRPGARPRHFSVLRDATGAPFVDPQFAYTAPRGTR